MLSGPGANASSNDALVNIAMVSKSNILFLSKVCESGLQCKNKFR
jgi:hypothetical protein